MQLFLVGQTTENKLLPYAQLDKGYIYYPSSQPQSLENISDVITKVTDEVV